MLCLLNVLKHVYIHIDTRTDRGGGGYSPLGGSYYSRQRENATRSAAKLSMTVHLPILFTHYIGANSDLLISWKVRSQVSLSDPTSHHLFATLKPCQNQTR